MLLRASRRRRRNGNYRRMLGLLPGDCDIDPGLAGTGDIYLPGLAGAGRSSQGQGGGVRSGGPDETVLGRMGNPSAGPPVSGPQSTREGGRGNPASVPTA